MESDNIQEKQPTEPIVNSSPTHPQQEEPVREPEPVANSSPTHLQQEEQIREQEPIQQEEVLHSSHGSDDQPLIEDETYDRQPLPHHENNFGDPIDEPIIGLNEGLNPIVRENIPPINNEIDPNLENEFYQRSLQHVVQGLNNLTNTLQVILRNNEINQHMAAGLQQGFPNAGNIQAGLLNNENQLQDQLVNLRRALGGGDDPAANANYAFEWNTDPLNQMNVLNFDPHRQNQRNNQVNWLDNAENYIRQTIASIPKDLNTAVWIVFIVAVMLFLFGLRTIPSLKEKNVDYVIEWLAFQKGSRLLLLV